jgi:hypothetical protein
MGVTFTSNVGLAKPDETELAENWVNGPNLQDDNNQILIAQTNIPLNTYTPTLKAQTTDPTTSGGTIIQGEYQDIQGIVTGTFRFLFVTGVTVGSGEYGVSLPFPADATYHSVGTAFNHAVGGLSIIGEGYIHQGSTVNNSGSIALDVVTVGGVSYARLLFENFAGKTSRVIRDTQPWSIANGNNWHASFMYKKA